MNLLLKIEAEIRAEADRLLASGLRQILDDYGEVHVVGSHLLHLMVWRDLDIHIVKSPLERNSFFTLGNRIADLLKPHRMHYRDETIVATPGLPKGLYWGIYLGDERNGAWKIDVWASDREEFERTRSYCDRILGRLTEPKRETILRLKSACWQHPEYRRRFSSADIYEAVLECDVVDMEGFQAFFRERGRAIQHL
jgi:hypothetical protein